MVARISHGRGIAGVLFYNKRKIDAGTASALGCHNLPVRPLNGKIDTRGLCNAFAPWLSHPRSRIEQPVFHVSLNPHPEDRLDDMQLQQIAHYYMQRMGYGEQPYVIYRHDDIARTHLHVVASRIRPDGHAVDYQEYKRRSKAVTEEIERVFSLIPAERGPQQQPSEELHPVRYRDSNLKAQLASVLHHVVGRYRFTSRGELATLLREFNIWIEECRGEAAGRTYTGIIYGALDEQGQKVGKPLASSRISRRFGYEALQGAYEASKRWIRDNKQELEPTRMTIRRAMRTARTVEEFTQAIRQGGLSVVFHRSDRHEGRIYGVTFVDHRNNLVINGSRLDKAFAANRFEELFTRRTQEPPKRQPAPLQPMPAAGPELRDEPIATMTLESEEQFFWIDGPQQMWTPHHGLGLLGVLLEEATRDKWEPWTPVPKRRKKRIRRK